MRHDELPLAGVTVLERADGVAAAYAGRLLSVMGAETIIMEPEAGSRLRYEPPFLAGAPDVSALFAYLSAGKRSVIHDSETKLGRANVERLLVGADILIDDTPVADRASLGLDPDTIAGTNPAIVHVSVLPFGATGLKRDWKGEEINLIHASGEGYLLPNGLSVDLFPGRPPLKIHGHFADMQGGIAAAFGALAALWVRKLTGGQFVDISVQDAVLAVGAFAVQRFGDGSIEHRATRSFKYGGVLECKDGFVEVLTLEERQWVGMIELMGRPDWALDKALRDPLERSRRGPEINEYIRAWARDESAADLVPRAQALGVPMAKYNSPADVLSGLHEQARQLFQPIDVPGFGECEMLTAPFRFSDSALPVESGPPCLGQNQDILRKTAAS